jgi:hypothetical protein
MNEWNNRKDLPHPHLPFSREEIIREGGTIRMRFPTSALAVESRGVAGRRRINLYPRTSGRWGGQPAAAREGLPGDSTIPALEECNALRAHSGGWETVKGK